MASHWSVQTHLDCVRYACKQPNRPLKLERAEFESRVSSIKNATRYPDEDVHIFTEDSSTSPRSILCLSSCSLIALMQTKLCSLVAF